jgi:hypothetical protein
MILIISKCPGNNPLMVTQVCNPRRDLEGGGRRMASSAWTNSEFKLHRENLSQKEGKKKERERAKKGGKGKEKHDKPFPLAVLFLQKDGLISFVLIYCSENSTLFLFYPPLSVHTFHWKQPFYYIWPLLFSPEVDLAT